MASFPGLPDTVLQNAAAMSQEFEGSYGKRLGADLSTQRWEDKASLIIENLIKIVATIDRHTLAESRRDGLLASLQYRARLLLEQN